MNTQHFLILPLLLGIALLPFNVECLTQKLDDFQTKDQNTMGGYRRGINVNRNLEYPQSSITIRNSGHFLVETFSRDEKIRTSVAGTSLKVIYNSLAAGKRTIKYIQHSDKSKESAKKEFGIQVHFEEVSNGVGVAVIPFTDFEGADVTLGYGIAIGGPLEVKSIELVDVHRETESIEYYQNINYLRLSRSGEAITKLNNGVEIGETGYLIEELAPGKILIDLTNKIVRIIYSAKEDGHLNLQLLNHAYLERWYGDKGGSPRRFNACRCTDK